MGINPTGVWTTGNYVRSLYIYSSCQLKVVDLLIISINTRSANADGIKKELHGQSSHSHSEGNRRLSLKGKLGDGKSELGFRKEMHSLRDRFQSVIDGLKEDIGVLKKAVASTPSGDGPSELIACLYLHRKRRTPFLKL